MLELLNALLYLGTLIVYWKRYKKIDVYFLLMAAYSFTAVMCFWANLYPQAEFREVSLIPFLYMYICIYICFKPFRGYSISSNLEIEETSIIKALTWIFILTGFAAIAYTLPQAMELINSGEWGMLRQLLYEDEDNIQLYGSALEKLCKNIHGYLSPFGIVMCFYSLSSSYKSRLTSWLLWISWLGYAFLGGMLVASRGIIISLLLNVVVLFFLFKDFINALTRRVFAVSGIAFSVLVGLYTAAVSISRFGDEAGISVFEYLGHSMTAFNQAVMGTMHSYAWGQYGLEFFYNLFGIPITFNGKEAGLTSGSSFFTFLGAFYIDYGPIGTFMLVTVLSKLLLRLTHKKSIRISDLMIIVYFIGFFMDGVFVIGKGYMLSWVMLYVLYLIVRSVENKTNTK